MSNEPALQYGARCVSEQKFDHNKMGCHTARYAKIVSMFNEALYDGQNETLRDIAFRSFNWAGYMVEQSGRAVVGPAASGDLWFNIQVDAYMYMLHAMRHVSHWPPAHDHMFEFSCAPKSVRFSPGQVAYTVSCAAATEVLKVTFAPEAVTAGGVRLPRKADAPAAAGYYEYTASSGLLTITHRQSSAVHVQGPAAAARTQAA